MSQPTFPELLRDLRNTIAHGNNTLLEIRDELRTLRELLEARGGEDGNA